MRKAWIYIIFFVKLLRFNLYFIFKIIALTIFSFHLAGISSILGAVYVTMKINLSDYTNGNHKQAYRKKWRENVGRAGAGGGKGGIGRKLSQDNSKTCNLYFLLLSIAYVR